MKKQTIFSAILRSPYRFIAFQNFLIQFRLFHWIFFFLCWKSKFQLFYINLFFLRHNVYPMQ